MIEVTAAVIWRDQQFLICQRPAGKSCALLWEFPGGKIEKGESAQECIIRECREELGITLEVFGEFTDVIQEYPDRTVHLHFFHTRIASGELKLAEHHAAAWVTADELEGYEFCPADAKMLAGNKIYSPQLFGETKA